jgi:hypothetical protein
VTQQTWMPDALRHKGLDVKELKGWKDRGRPGTFEPRGVVFHHTASGRQTGALPSLTTCRDGRPDLNGPLCNILVGRDGSVVVVAAGRANHAGEGGPFRNIPKDSGNAYLIGVEVEHNGKKELWTPELLEVCDRVFAALLIGLRRRSVWLIGHKEWAPHRKIDPATVGRGLPTMDEVRNRATAEIRMTGMALPKAHPTPHHISTVVVKKHDTLFHIALVHHMSVKELKALNGLHSNLIKIGQTLKVRT